MEDPVRNGGYGSQSSLSLPRLDGSQDVITTTARRRLLLIYIHGFRGSEESFRDFPAHVHDLLTGLLSESHVVYTRIYPRYKSHGEMHLAVDQFSAWLSPHEADDLDVILLGHSLGGILAADVALLQRGAQPRHRILGLVNFDVPFLGLHPRVIPTGIKSLGKKDPAPEDVLAKEEESVGLEPVFKPATPRPNFNPPFKNDVHREERGLIKGMFHFLNKNTENLSRSICDRVVSQYQFAGCVNNYSELRRKYRLLRELEAAECSPNRVRFLNYYTASTGRPPRKDSKKSDVDQNKDRELGSTASSSTSTLAAKEATNGKNNSQADLTSIDSSTSLSQENSRQSSTNASITTSGSDPSSNTSISKQKLRKFILMPSHHWKWEDDSHWTPVVMEDMDEVTAHQSMFIPQGANYDQLVGDCVALVEQWVQNDLSRRLLQESLD
ncbi:uncharacterized protein N7459_009364 [Penicillium hispanicum]|uniref:uncharacterized protein n=1 Tax=Penicillium hispanicum TaxID=1080232 RepID=UPI002540573F|nr:uncharacterized protein N7459_009364 [Penicillium hispanicum]KAJ5569934.1 hypothetical protein N7459_009364 [Penicillium hispanicum]